MGRPAAASVKIATPQRLLEAGLHEFAQRGLEGARLQDIAARAGITRPSLLHHFPTKEALYAAVVARAFGELGEVLMSAMSASGTFEERASSVVQAFSTWMHRRPALARVIVREIVAGEGPGERLLLEQAAPLLSAVEAFVEEGVEDVPVPVRAVLMHTISDVLLRAAARGPLREALWGGDEDAAWPILRAALLQTGVRR